MTASSDPTRTQLAPMPLADSDGVKHKAASRGNSVYHRFIPREEVQTATAWAFDAVDPKAHAAQRAAEAAAAAAATPDTLDGEALRQQAYDEGFAQGREAGEKATREALDAPLRRTAEDAAQRLATLLNNTQQALEESEDQLSQQLLALACDVARQVVRRELSQPLPAIRAVVDEALAATLQSDKPRTLRVNPMDYALLQNPLEGQLDTQRIQLVADDTISAGGCLLQTHTGMVDGTVEKRWARAVANLGLDVPWAAPVEAPTPEAPVSAAPETEPVEDQHD